MARPKKPIDFNTEILTIESKIEKHQKSISDLKAKRKMLVDSKSSATYDSLIDAIKESGKSPEDVLSMLQAESSALR